MQYPATLRGCVALWQPPEEELFDPPVTSEEAAALPPAAAANRPTRRQLSAAFKNPRFVEKKDSPPVPLQL